MQNILDLFNCIYHLGFTLGWDYWRLNNLIKKDAAVLERWIERLELEANMYEAEECHKIAAFMRDWIEKCKQSKKEHEKWIN